MMLSDKLDIVLITYNRKTHLQNTFEQIFAQNSPIKDFPITILDNCSTDGTTELIEEYSQKHKNINHIRHEKNIGGNANITRAFELPKKEYFWIICDDDAYDWSSWNEVEKAINEGKDAVIVTRDLLKKRENLGLITRQLTFLPAGIVYTKAFSSTASTNSV